MSEVTQKNAGLSDQESALVLAAKRPVACCLTSSLFSGVGKMKCTDLFWEIGDPTRYYIWHVGSYFDFAAA